MQAMLDISWKLWGEWLWDDWTYRENFIAKMAAMKKVLSPISETMMTEMEAMKAWKNPTLTQSKIPLVASSSSSNTTT